MKTIKTIDKLDIEKGFLVANKQQVFLKQGSVDGACGPYCLFMALIILGVIDYNDATNLWWTKRSSRFGKMLAKMQEHDTLFQNGTDLNQLQDLLEHSFKNTLEINVSEQKGRSLIRYCIEQLKQDKPTIIGVYGIDLAHWLLAVGYEENEEGEVCKLFFLDPSGLDNSNYWNAAIDVNETFHGRYSYAWVDCTEERLVSFEHGISLGLK
ncbi:MAG: hypothetical protein KBC58_07680 [Flavobacterium sp.]|nr:hypothetical protein [Flavobacterium sp.]